MEKVGEETAEPVWQGAAENYSDYEVPYWVAYPTLPSPGFWGVTAQGDAANFIHIEVYQDFQTLTCVPEMAEWGLSTEPWILS